MFQRARRLGLATAIAAVALAIASIPASADEQVQNLGPVGPREPIIATVGSKNVIAFYEPDSGACLAHLVVWNTTDVDAATTVSFEVMLEPLQVARIGTPERGSLDLQCGDNAESLAIAESAKLIPALSR